jgi:hypothetical protein
MEAGRYRTKDGHQVRSRAEVIIDNVLFDLNINHEYEKELRLGSRTYKPDWYLPDHNLYIEFWGMEDDRSYQIYQREKQKVYGEYHVHYLSLGDKDIVDRLALEDKIMHFLNRFQGYKSEKVGIFELAKLGKFPLIFFLFPLLYTFTSGMIGFSLILLGIIPTSSETNSSITIFLLFLGYLGCYFFGKLTNLELNNLEIKKTHLISWKIVLFFGLVFFISYVISSTIFRPLSTDFIVNPDETLPRDLISFVVEPFIAWLLGGFYIIKRLVSV